jgi:hypothetical protein
VESCIRLSAWLQFDTKSSTIQLAYAMPGKEDRSKEPKKKKIDLLISNKSKKSTCSISVHLSISTIGEPS